MTVVATAEKPWLMDDGNADIEVLEGVRFNQVEMLAKRKG
jgi:hypothetical protein